MKSSNLRITLIVCIWFSLLLVPYSFFAYLCYRGLCGGSAAAEIRNLYAGFYGYFMFIYPVVAVIALFISRQFKQNNRIKISIYPLLVPFICLIPFIYVEWQTIAIENKYAKIREQYYLPHADDYVCSSDKFIRYNNQYYFFDNSDGAHVMAAYQNLDELKKKLATESIDITSCKNQNNDSL